MKPWHEQDEFWKLFGPVLFNEERLVAAPQEIEKIVALTSLAPGATVLDMPCGPGRHALELARRGYRVTGVDRTALYLDLAEQQAMEEGLTVEWVGCDMREFCREETFDVAINLFTSFGYFNDPADDRRVLVNLLRSLRPGGTLVMDLMGKEVVARIFEERDWHEEADGTILLREHKISSDWGWIENRWILLNGETRREFNFSHRIYSAAELKALLNNVGFHYVNTYGSLEEAPYDHEAERLVVTARKE